MDHGGMDHGHMGHGDMDMGSKCSMNMIFTWKSDNLCVIFEQWRITGTLSLVMSLLAIVVLTAGYECLRAATKNYEQSHNARLAAFSSAGSRRDSKKNAERQGKLTMGVLYALQVFYSFFIMLLFMTYNGWIMIAVAVGAFVGYMAFTADLPATKSVACH